MSNIPIHAVDRYFIHHTDGGCWCKHFAFTVGDSYIVVHDAGDDDPPPDWPIRDAIRDILIDCKIDINPDTGGENVTD